MHYTTATILLSAATVLAAPLTERADCPTCVADEKFVNGQFNGAASEWYLARQTGAGTATGGAQSTYYPTSWPFNGQPQAYALNINMPAQSTKVVRLEQVIGSGVKNGASYSMALAYHLMGTGSASCEWTNYAGSDPTSPIVHPLGQPVPAPAQPSSINWAYMTDTIVGNNPGSPVQANIAGGILTCYTGSTAANLSFLIDGFSFKQKC